MRKRILSWLLTVTLVLALFPTAALAEPAPIENGLWLTPESHTLNLYEASMGTITGTCYENGQVSDLTEEGMPNDISWSVDDSTVIRLDKTNSMSGEQVTVWALKAGTATITATCQNYTEKIDVTVAAPIRLTMAEPNNTIVLAPPELVDGSTVTTNNAAVVMVSETEDNVGIMLSAVAPGTTTVTVTEPSGTVYDIPVYVDYDQVFWDVNGVLIASTHQVGSLPAYPNGIPTLNDTANVKYVFKGWEPQITEVVSNAGTVYKAIFEKHIIYDIAIADIALSVGDGGNRSTTVNDKASYFALGEMDEAASGLPEGTVLTSDKPEIVTVSLSGTIWSVEAKAAGTTTITATCGEAPYIATTTFDVTVTNDDGYHTITFNVPGVGVERIVVRSGEVPVPTISTDRPADFNATYTFTGWAPEITAAVEDITYVAQYDIERIQYKVIFKNWDSTVLREQTYFFGDTPEYKWDNPTRPVDSEYYYMFTGWDNPIAQIDGSQGTTITYTATYSPIPRSEVSYSLEISDSTLQLPNDSTYTLSVESTPMPGMQQGQFIWDSADPDIVAIISPEAPVNVSSVEIKAMKPGSTTIIVTDGNQTASCYVTVVGRTFTVTWVTDADNNISIPEDCMEGETPSYKPNSGIPAKAADALYYYVFKGWDKTIVPCTGDVTYTALYDRFRLVELNIDPSTMDLFVGSEPSTGSITAELTPDNTGAEVTFESTNEDVATVDEDGNVTAVGAGTCNIIVRAGNQEKICRVTVKIPKVTIKWYTDPENLSFYTESTVTKGEVPVYPLNGGTPQKEDTAQYHWAFTGWEPEITAANANQSYLAKFTRTVRQYTVTWDDGQGNIKTDTYDYGTVFTKPENPTKPDDVQYAYEFMGWKEDTEDKLNDPYEVVKNLHFTAQFNQTRKSTLYIVEKQNSTYKTTMYVGDYQQLTDFAYPSSMMRRWKSSDPSVATINSDGYMQAKAVGKTTISVESNDGSHSDSFELTVAYLQFTVTWNVNGYITTEKYNRGDMPEFKGDTSRIPSNTTVYTFIGWDKPLAAVAGDITYTAVYSETPRKYTVTWVNNGVTTTQEYLYNEMPQYQGATQKPATEDKTYLFTGWEPTLAPVTEDITYTAQYEEEDKLCTITWIVDGVSKQSLCAYGRIPVYPDGTPTKTMTETTIYTFDKWNTPLVPVTGPATYVAQFKETVRKYAITWDVNGTKSTEEYEYNAMPMFRGETERTQTEQNTYTFLGWNPEITRVTEDTTYTARYNEVVRKYTILFKNWDGTTMKTYNLEYGAMPDTSVIKPTRPDTTENGKTTTYEFKGWTPDVTKVTKNATYTATYNATTKGGTSGGSGTGTTDPALAKKEFEITFRNWDREILETATVKGGTKPTYSGKTPTRPTTKNYRYTFTGWSPEIVAAEENMTYTAQFKSSSATKLVLTENDMADAAKNPMNIYHFPEGTLYINEEGMKELQSIKAKITIEVTKKNAKDDTLTIRFLKGENETLITKDMEGLLFLATYMDDGDVIALADDNKTNERNFNNVIFSVINQAGAYVPIPGSCTIRPQDSITIFNDLSLARWAEGYISFCAARSLVEGIGGLEFAPDATITRAQAAVIAHRLMEKPQPYGGKAFDDVSPFEWYSAAIAWATSERLITGLADTQFSPNTGITRGDQVLLLYRLAQTMGYDCKERSKLAKYHDAGLLKTGDQTTAMEWAVATGIIEGTSNVTLSPRNPTARAEFCAMMYRFISYLTIWDTSEAVDHA